MSNATPMIPQDTFDRNFRKIGQRLWSRFIQANPELEKYADIANDLNIQARIIHNKTSKELEISFTQMYRRFLTTSAHRHRVSAFTETIRIPCTVNVTLKDFILSLGYQENYYHDVQKDDLIRSLPSFLIGEWDEFNTKLNIRVHAVSGLHAISPSDRPDDYELIRILFTSIDVYALPLLPTAKRNLDASVQRVNKKPAYIRTSDLIEPIDPNDP